jgi:hypothetical protein
MLVIKLTVEEREVCSPNQSYSEKWLIHLDGESRGKSEVQNATAIEKIGDVHYMECESVLSCSPTETGSSHLCRHSSKFNAGHSHNEGYMHP